MLRLLEKIINKFLLFQYKYFEKNVSIGKGTSIRSGFYARTCGSGKIIIGRNCFINRFFSATAFSLIEIGDDTIIGENVKIYDHNHCFNGKGKIMSQGFRIEDVKIGSNVWIGSGVIILKGVSIGDNCVIGAGCIVTSNIENNTICFQNRELCVNPINYRE